MSHTSPVQPYRRLLPASERQASTSDLPKSRRRSEAKITSACLLCKQKRIKVKEISLESTTTSLPSFPTWAI